MGVLIAVQCLWVGSQGAVLCSEEPAGSEEEIQEREKVKAGCLWSSGVWHPTGNFVYPPPRRVMVGKGLYQKHGQPYALIPADFLGLLLKWRCLLCAFLLLLSPEWLLNTLFPGTSNYCVGRGLDFSLSNWKGREQYHPLSPQFLKTITAQHRIIIYSGAVQTKRAIKAL